LIKLYQGDCLDVLKRLPSGSVHCVVTSPPYWGLRDYGVASQIGLEPSPGAYVERIVRVFREIKRVLRDDGTAWVNLGDSYAQSQAGRRRNGQGNIASPCKIAVESPGETRDIPAGLKPKDLCGIPWRVAFALQADGWYLRSDIIWAKSNPMPESVRDRPTKSHEYLFLLTKQSRYYFDADAVRECFTDKRMGNPGNYRHAYCDGAGRRDGQTSGLAWTKGEERGGRNIRTVWTIPTQPYKGAHFATFPRRLVSPCIKAGCPTGGIVLDPFAGSGTTGAEAVSLGRDFIGIDLNPAYLKMARARIAAAQPALKSSAFNPSESVAKK
jgi:DNA modification methylase